MTCISMHTKYLWIILGGHLSRAHTVNPLDCTKLSGLPCSRLFPGSDQTSSKVFALIRGKANRAKLTGLGANTHVHSRNQRSWLLENSKG